MYTNANGPVEQWLSSIEPPMPLLQDAGRTPLQPTQSKSSKTPAISKALRSSGRAVLAQPQITVIKRRKIMADASDKEGAQENCGTGRRGNSGRTRRVGQGSRTRGKVRGEQAAPRRGRSAAQATTLGGGTPTDNIISGLDGTREDDFAPGIQDTTTVPLGGDLGNLRIGEATPLPPPSESASSPTKTTTSGRSPSRIPKAKITREQLSALVPCIEFKTVDQAKEIWPAHVRSLWGEQVKSLVRSLKVIPPGLKQRMMQDSDTPAKSKLPPEDGLFETEDRHPMEDLEFIWRTISGVLDEADRHRTANTPESHWATFVVAPLLALVRQLSRFQNVNGRRQLETLDISSTAIDPLDLCPYLSNPDVFRVLNRKIDFAMGLALPAHQNAALKHGNFQHHFQARSINQTTSWVNFVPMFVNIEVKKKYSMDPMVQLAAWVAAEFEKRQRERYSLDMPVFAIAIEEDTWNLWIAYWVGSAPETLIFMGPEYMGDTKNHSGIFKILKVLQGLAEWGTTTYRAWFEGEVLGRASSA